MYTTIWQYELAAGQSEKFEAYYGQAGPWVALFRGASGYRETVLLRDVSDSARYVTLDHWDSADAYERFRRDSGDEYARIDSEAAGLTIAEHHLGTVTS